MPIYEFQCEKCNQVQEHMMDFDAPMPESCDACGGKLSKLLSRTSFALKGSGWYTTDYKRKSSDTASAASPASNVSSKKEG